MKLSRLMGSGNLPARAGQRKESLGREPMFWGALTLALVMFVTAGAILLTYLVLSSPAGLWVVVKYIPLWGTP